MKNTTKLAIAAALVLGGAALAVAATAREESADVAAADDVRPVDGAILDAGVTSAELGALRAATGPQSAALRVVHPPDGAVYPEHFPPPRLQWADSGAGRLYRVVVSQGERVFYEGLTRRRELTMSQTAWDAARQAGGELTVRVVGATAGPNAAMSAVALSAPATVRIASHEERPTGMILFGQKHRPERDKLGTVPLLMLHLRIDGFDVERLEHRILFRSSYGPEKTRMHPARLAEEQGEGGEGGEGGEDRGGGGAGDDEAPGGGGFHGGHGADLDDGLTRTQCVSCHAVSHDGRYVAVFSQTAEEAPPEFDAPNGFLTVLSMPDRKVVIQLPHAFVPQFNPKDSNILVYGEVDETIGTKDQQIVRKSDLQILDLRTKTHRPLPGAATPDHVENFPFWGPGGAKIAFIRTKKGQMWHGAAGHIDIATIPYNEGRGGVARLLKGASDNGRSNFLPVYSPDGRWLVFAQADQGFFSQQSADLWIVPADGGQARKLGCNSGHTESWHRFSPDGRWLGMVTNREDIRRPHIYIARFDAQTGTCAPPIQLPFASGPGAHTHAFSWTPTFDWLDDFEAAAR